MAAKPLAANGGGDVVGKASPILDLTPELRLEICHHVFSTQELTKQVPMPGQAVFTREPLTETLEALIESLYDAKLEIDGALRRLSIEIGRSGSLTCCWGFSTASDGDAAWVLRLKTGTATQI
ncbi:hypothetical protein B0A55_04865 [Friedmanniomyces simplex]|uniref:Uncharacterized protein n=1 Tax=Friedmanniomyces simplex TaxID=329884 RepID=A0A4U0XIC0_9PEZI|nr:hypothetical protein B0A55_04865 [Friedmanniomyces simplex]